MREAYTRLKHELPATRLPDGVSIRSEQVKPENLLSFSPASAVIAPNLGNSTSFVDLHHLLALGVDSFEVPPSDSGLKPEDITSFVRNNTAWTDPKIFSQLVQTAEHTRQLSTQGAEEYIREQIPVSTLWGALASQKALEGLDKLCGNKLLENNHLRPEYAQRSVVVNGDNGGGNFSIVHRAGHKDFSYSTSYDFLSATQTNFVANHLGAGRARTEAAACSGFGYGVHLAEVMARDPEEPIDLAIVFSSYEGPVEETKASFHAADIHTSSAVPYLGIDRRGYVESQAATAHVFISRRFADELGLDITSSRLIRTVTHEGSSVWGVKKGSLPDVAFQKAGGLIKHYYEDANPFTGTIICSLHGANTLGAPIEMDALSKGLQGVPDAYKEITVTTSLMGHQYSPRLGLSLGLQEQAADEGVLWGMAPSYLDLSDIGEEKGQAIRRAQIAEIGICRPTETIIFDSRNPKKNTSLQIRALENMKKLRETHTHLAYASETIPNHPLILASHQGLGGVSACLIAFPIDR